MLSRAQRHVILVESIRANVPKAALALEAIDAGVNVRTELASLHRALHLMKSDAQAAGLHDVARPLDHVERMVEASREFTGHEVDARLVTAMLEAVDDAGRRLAQGQTPMLPEALRTDAEKAGAEARQRLRSRIRPA